MPFPAKFTLLPDAIILEPSIETFIARTRAIRSGFLFTFNLNVTAISSY